MDEVLLPFTDSPESIRRLIKVLRYLPIPPGQRKRALTIACKVARLKPTQQDYQQATGLTKP